VEKPTIQILLKESKGLNQYRGSLINQPSFFIFESHRPIHNWFISFKNSPALALFSGGKGRTYRIENFK